MPPKFRPKAHRFFPLVREWDYVRDAGCCKWPGRPLVEEAVPIFLAAFNQAADGAVEYPSKPRVEFVKNLLYEASQYGIDINSKEISEAAAAADKKIKAARQKHRSIGELPVPQIGPKVKYSNKYSPFPFDK
jgi:hypothetical protein